MKKTLLALLISFSLHGIAQPNLTVKTPNIPLGHNFPPFNLGTLKAHHNASVAFFNTTLNDNIIVRFYNDELFYDYSGFSTPGSLALASPSGVWCIISNNNGTILSSNKITVGSLPIGPGATNPIGAPVLTVNAAIASPYDNDHLVITGSVYYNIENEPSLQTTREYMYIAHYDVINNVMLNTNVVDHQNTVGLALGLFNSGRDPYRPVIVAAGQNKDDNKLVTVAANPSLLSPVLISPNKIDIKMRPTDILTNDFDPNWYGSNFIVSGFSDEPVGTPTICDLPTNDNNHKYKLVSFNTKMIVTGINDFTSSAFYTSNGKNDGLLFSDEEKNLHIAPSHITNTFFATTTAIQHTAGPGGQPNQSVKKIALLEFDTNLFLLRSKILSEIDVFEGEFKQPNIIESGDSMTLTAIHNDFEGNFQSEEGLGVLSFNPFFPFNTPNTIFRFNDFYNGAPNGKINYHSYSLTYNRIEESADIVNIGIGTYGSQTYNDPLDALPHQYVFHFDHHLYSPGSCSEVLQLSTEDLCIVSKIETNPNSVSLPVIGPLSFVNTGISGSYIDCSPNNIEGTFRRKINTSEQLIDAGTVLNIFPNPAKNILNVIGSIQFDQISTYKIINIQGKLIKNGSFNELNKIYISELESGTYLIEIVHENEIFRTKFLKY